MASRLALCVYLLSLLSVCISDYGCTLVNERYWRIRSGIVSQVGTYTMWSSMSYSGSIPFHCWIYVSGNREGITRRIQIYDYNTYVGACSGSVTISKGSLDEKFTLQLCGREKPQSYQDNWDYLNITVPTDSRVNLTVEDVFVNGKPVLGNEVELPVDAAWTTLTSFGYPKGYPSFLNFTYILKSESSKKIEISVLDLDMDGYYSSLRCEDDYIDIGGAETKHRWCQGSHSLTSQGPILNITLRTDALGSARGFQLRYRESPILPLASTTLAPTWTTPPRWAYITVIATEQPQTLTQSVNQVFHDYVDYRWTIENFKRSASRIKVTFTNVDLGEEVNCSQARVTLYEGTVDDSNELDVLCGRVTPGVSFSWLSPLTIRLQTNGIAPAHMRGFLLEYQSTAADEVDSCNSTVQVYSNATYLTFASRASGPADSVECWWKLRAPTGSRVSLQSEVLNLQGPGPLGCSDWLQVYNGLSSNAAPLSEKVCGSTSVSVASTGQTMLVRVHTDGSNAFSSFRLQVTAVPRSFCENGQKSVRVKDSAIIEATQAPDDNSDSDFAHYPCTWRLSATNSADALQLNFSSYLLGSSLDCNSGSLKVINCGRYRDQNLPLAACLGEQGFVTTQTNCIMVTLIWSRSSDGQGFWAEVRTKSRPSATTRLSLIPILVPLGVSIFTVIVICVISCWACRMKRSTQTLQTGNDVTLQTTQGSHGSLNARRRELDQGRQIQSTSASVIAGGVLMNSAPSEPPPPYPGPMPETMQMDPPPSYASLEGCHGTSTLRDASPPAYSEVQFAD